MGELEEFAEALLDQLSVEINEEKEIAELSEKIKEDPSFSVNFEKVEDITQKIFSQMAKKVKTTWYESDFKTKVIKIIM